MVIFHPKKRLVLITSLKVFSVGCILYLFSYLPCHANPILLVLGDSLSAAYQIPPEEGWVSLLENKLRETYPSAKVINSSLVGDTTANGLERLPSLLEKYQPTIVIIEMGGNDGLRGLPIEAIRTNLSKMIDLSLKNNAKVLLVGIRLPPNYGGNYTKQFYANYTGLIEEYKVAFVPFLLENVALKPTLMFPDRIHPNREAQPILLKNVWPHLTPLLPAQ